MVICGKSTFDSKILNKNQLIFIIEDTEGNKFGGYIDSTIDTIYDGHDRTRITDSKSFIFSLESNGRLNNMKKFNVKEPEYAFCLFDKSDNCLFTIGYLDIIIYKKGSEYKPYCKQNSFNYEGIKTPLCGKDDFDPFELKRFIIIQMK